ncbi:hypothetical protein [Deinococcus sonorensis]|uniref:DUF5667 domain-containing protein n=2 Tax=Deinococcus sonorensis TaxID=309891 RepID=A0AAU7UCB6_9DEIO
MLYARQRRTLPLWAALLLPLLTLLLGFTAGRLSAPKATLAAALAPASAHLLAASGALDIAGLEGTRAAQGNAESRAASLRAAQTARTAVLNDASLQQLYPDQTATFIARLDEVDRAVQARRDPATPLADARAALRTLTERLRAASR